jgi:hypothetical protein
MKLLRVFPRRTSYTPNDDLAFVGDPPLMLPDVDEVHVSGVFSWDRTECERLAEAWHVYYPKVLLGGPAFGSPVDGFIPGRYVREGVTFTSRGCNRHCSFCIVPSLEGPLRLLDPFADGHVIQDNNFLMTPKAHRERVYEMLRRQRKGAIFAGGVDARLITAEVGAEWQTIRITEIFLAADTPSALVPLARAIEHIGFLGRAKLRCYVLIGKDGETMDQAESRLRAAWNIGVMPFAQLYQPTNAAKRLDYGPEWQALQRTWTRPAGMKAHMRQIQAEAAS